MKSGSSPPAPVINTPCPSSPGTFSHSDDLLAEVSMRLGLGSTFMELERCWCFGPRVRQWCTLGNKRAFPWVAAELGCTSAGSLVEFFGPRGCFLLWLYRLMQQRAGGTLGSLCIKSIAWPFVALQDRPGWHHVLHQVIWESTWAFKYVESREVIVIRPLCLHDLEYFLLKGI